MRTVLSLGLTTVDICSYVEIYPSSNEKVRASKQLVFAGGPAANASVAASALGCNVRLLTGVGSDALAGLALADLQRYKVEVIDRQENVTDLPVLSSIIIESERGDRSVVYTDTAGRKLKIGDPFEELLAGTDLVFFDGYFLDQAIPLAKQAKSKKIPTVIDCGSWKEGLENLLPCIDYAICSSDFFPPGCKKSEQVLEYLFQAGVNNRAISRGAESIIYEYRSGQGEVPVEAREPVDTLGAGDILHGAFCRYILETDFVGALEKAAALASLSCMYRGTRKWIEHL